MMIFKTVMKSSHTGIHENKWISVADSGFGGGGVDPKGYDSLLFGIVFCRKTV